MGALDYINKKRTPTPPLSGGSSVSTPFAYMNKNKTYTPSVYQNAGTKQNIPTFTPTKSSSAGVSSAKWLFGKSKSYFDWFTNSLAETKYFTDVGRGLVERRIEIGRGEFKGGTKDFLGETLLENTSEVAQSFSGRGTANIIDTVIASPINFATRAIYGKSNPVGDYLSGVAEEMRDTFTTDRARKVNEQTFGLAKLVNPDFWLITAASQMPTTMAFMGVAGGFLREVLH